MTFTNKMLDSEATTKLLSELTATNNKMVNEIEWLSARLESIEEAESQKWRVGTDNELIDQLKYYAAERRDALGGEISKVADSLLAVEDLEEDAHEAVYALRSDETEYLQTLVQNGLSRAEKLIIILYYYEENTHKEIATVLDLSESRVKQMHSCALARMKTRMAHRALSKSSFLKKLYNNLSQRNVYHWTSTALHEKRDESEKSHLQVSRDDYRKAIAAIQKSFELEEHINVKLICAQMDEAASIDGSSIVPSTQLYLILRFLKANGLIRKSGGSSYEYVGEGSANSFSERVPIS